MAKETSTSRLDAERGDQDTANVGTPGGARDRRKAERPTIIERRGNGFNEGPPLRVALRKWTACILLGLYRNDMISPRTVVKVMRRWVRAGWAMRFSVEQDRHCVSRVSLCLQHDEGGYYWASKPGGGTETRYATVDAAIAWAIKLWAAPGRGMD